MILESNNYGEIRVRLMKVTRQPDRHDLKEIAVDIQFEGGFEPAYKEGDNADVLAAGAIKNTVCALAGQSAAETVEDFGLRLSDYFLAHNPKVSAVRVDLSEHPWERLQAGGRPHRFAFMRPGAERHTAHIRATRDALKVESGIADLLVIKTAGPSFEGFKNDEFAGRPEPSGRLFETAIAARWNFTSRDISYGPAWHGIRQMILDTFTEHASKSVQHALYAIGEAVLDQCEEVDEIRISMPDKYCLPINASRSGVPESNEIFLPVDEPQGLIEATLKKSDTWTSTSSGSRTRRFRLRLQ